MKILLVTLVPDGPYGEGGADGAASVDADATLRALGDLGCDVTAARFEHIMDGLWGDRAPKGGRPPPAPGPPQVLLIDGKGHLESAYACLKKLRERPDLAGTPALITVTTSRLPSLDFGAADDFLLSPVVPAEIYARLRQLDWRFAAFATGERMKIGDLVIDLAGYEAHLRDRKLELTRQEFELLKFLARHRGKVFTREQLLARVWGRRSFGGARTVDIHVRRLRAKLGAVAGGAAPMIETVRNVGYKIRGE